MSDPFKRIIRVYSNCFTEEHLTLNFSEGDMKLDFNDVKMLIRMSCSFVNLITNVSEAVKLKEFMISNKILT